MSSKGFTLIELIMVVVILGVLAAFALPKFASFNSDSEVAAIKGARSAVKSALLLTYSKFQTSGNDTSTKFTNIELEGNNSGGLIWGFPDNATLTNMVDLDGFALSTPTIQTLKVSINESDCHFIYTQATSTAVATVSDLVDCD